MSFNIFLQILIYCSVSDPLHFDPDPRIRFWDNGSGSDSVLEFQAYIKIDDLNIFVCSLSGKRTHREKSTRLCTSERFNGIHCKRYLSIFAFFFMPPTLSTYKNIRKMSNVYCLSCSIVIFFHSFLTILLLLQ